MLKALEISGFKSFADKTRFEFPPGITVVVGPNGSGKSNIVDAIKWVLGEQSAKSLRGKDMSDVIFKGSSGANARKPANSAAATLVLENADGRLMADSPEVHVTRRVYRSGESEYLINNTPCRLKDVRALFRGTGVGTDAYSLIEQGKVDRLLQASAKDRRAIFEEAAGISRFKAKKIEAERRLERVDANLLRLADIVEEVGNRYRSIKSQASKAAKYKEFSDRLKELRTFAGRKDYRQLTQRLTELANQQEPLELRSNELQRAIESAQVAALECEQQWDAANHQAAEIQERINSIRAEQAQAESQLQLNQQRREDLSQRLAQLATQSQRDTTLLAELDSQQLACRQDCDQTQAAVSTHLQLQQQLQTELDQHLQSYQDLDRQSQQLTLQIGERNQQLVELAQQVSSLQSQVELTRVARDRQQRLVAETEAELQTTSAQLAGVAEQRQQQQHAAEENDSALKLAQQATDSLQQRLTEQQALVSELKSRSTGVAQRAKVIDEMEKRWEGINSGARGLMQKARSEPGGIYQEVVGLVADLIQVNVQHAAMVDAALGAVSQYVVVRGQQLLAAIHGGQITVTGRAGIIPWDEPITLGTDLSVDLNDHPLIIGNVFALVQTQPDAADFVRRLLGGTWIVKSLADAHTARQTLSNRVRYITLDGEVLETDGVLIVGPKASAEGIVSRRSELRALRREQQELQDQKKEAEEQERQWAGELRFSQMQLANLINQNQALSRGLAELNIRQQTLEQQLRSQQSQADKQRAEWQQLESQVAQVEQQAADANRQRQQTTSSLNQLQQRWDQTQSELGSHQQRRTQLDQQLADLRVQVVSGEQRLQSQQQRQLQLDEQIQQLKLQLAANAAQLAVDQESLSAAEQGLQSAQSRLETTSRQRDELSQQLLQLAQSRNEWDTQRRTFTQQLSVSRKQLQETETQLHENQLKRQQLESELNVLAQRLLEDYNLDVRTFHDDPADSSAVENREAVDQEISDLRQKLSSLGSVNMQALHELEQLETRYLALDQQYQDLVTAKESLTRIIQRINQDSRKLFAETVEAIRVNFQKLFRQTFGGGQADIVIEEGVDILEAGVEIVATPPGKPKFSNSLLSGGEKALTAVSLLMAIFQFRPSPFCVLDEVDAPFDEANIGRFVDVLKSFLGWTKFVIVTHSKKTMTAANTLYGVTMQESGVSKRVSVRFEDVSEDGQISQEAIERSASSGDSTSPQAVA